MSKVCTSCREKLREALETMPMLDLIEPEQREATLNELVDLIEKAHANEPV